LEVSGAVRFIYKSLGVKGLSYPAHVEGKCSVHNVCRVVRKYLTSYKYLHVYR